MISRTMTANPPRNTKTAVATLSMSQFRHALSSPRKPCSSPKAGHRNRNCSTGVTFRKCIATPGFGRLPCVRRRQARKEDTDRRHDRPGHKHFDRTLEIAPVFALLVDFVRRERLRRVDLRNRLVPVVATGDWFVGSF